MISIFKLFIQASMLCLWGFSTTVQAAYHQTLPKGVRLLVYKHVQASGINSLFGESGKREALSFGQTLDAKSIEQIPGVDVYLDEIKNINPAAYEDFTLGRYDIEATGHVRVHGVGLAYGISDRLTAYMSIPIFDAQVRMKIDRTQGNNYEHIAELLTQKSDSSETAKLLGQLTKQLPDADGPLLQHVLTHQYGYQPLGHWRARALGDIEVAALYRLTDWSEGGLATSLGVILPTGRIDHPDILQDFGFGDGQYDIFAEFGGGIFLFDRRLSVSSHLRYTHQFASQKTYRLSETEDMPLSKNKIDLNEQLGPIFHYRFIAQNHITSWLNWQLGYDYTKQGLGKYDSPYAFANQKLAQDSAYHEHRLLAGVTLTSVELFQKKKSPIPASLNFTTLKTFAGENTHKVTRFDLELRIFF